MNCLWQSFALAFGLTSVSVDAGVLALGGGGTSPLGGLLQWCSNLLLYIISRFALKLVSFLVGLSARLPVCLWWYGGWSIIIRQRLSTSFCLGLEEADTHVPHPDGRTQVTNVCLQ